MAILQELTDKEKKFRYNELKGIRDRLLNDNEAPLYEYRTDNGYYPVIGEGNHAAKIMFIGEAPGENEAKKGRPFCGAAGKFLDVMLEHIGLDREKVYITNILKDRPQKNRDPRPDEIEYYSPLLDIQVATIKPSCIVALGRFSMDYIMRKAGLENKLDKISKIHGTVFSGEIAKQKVNIVTLYHPAVALYNGSMREVLKKDAEVLKQYLK